MIRDVDSKLKGIEFESESGEVIRHNGSSTFGDSKTGLRVYKFNEKLPPKIRLNLYFFRADSVVKVPFKAVDIPLP
ncbi:MAG: hypothetical protein F6K23_36220 [Okeania sp. SIO2C9]|uniref:hypothetical protein n=1 Tax=Okeania sp. SIO2C9 TaxID=2607791 RepID=UPI0013C153BE|nr:hypothetical protein [Okeania sp. SIO2C9]NEQ77978.1 hypothetical protein [Okeania sp. SIO2C9]